MNEKQIFIGILGGMAFSLLGGLLVIPIQWLAKRARKRYPDFQP
jgi:hypothetical protein